RGLLFGFAGGLKRSGRRGGFLGLGSRGLGHRRLSFFLPQKTGRGREGDFRALEGVQRRMKLFDLGKRNPPTVRGGGHAVVGAQLFFAQAGAHLLGRQRSEGVAAEAYVPAFFCHPLMITRDEKSSTRRRSFFAGK